MPLCVAAGGVVLALALESFTLAWTHSIEKIRWEEDYAVVEDKLRLTEARVRGHGAGMEPPPGSHFDGSAWHYVPALPLLPELRLTQSRFVAGYELCANGRCEPLADLLPPLDEDGAVVTLRACP